MKRLFSQKGKCFFRRRQPSAAQGDCVLNTPLAQQRLADARVAVTRVSPNQAREQPSNCSELSVSAGARESLFWPSTGQSARAAALAAFHLMALSSQR
jgi:hypothetical protein